MGKWFRLRRIPKMPGQRFRLSPGRQLLVSLLMGLILGIGVIVWINCQLRPMVLAVSESTLSNRVAVVVGQVLGEEANGELSYADLVQLHYDENGTLSAVTTQMEAGNLLRGRLISRLLTELTTMEEETVSVPIGSLTRLTLLSGQGFSIPVQVIGVSNIESCFDSSLSSAGINQTLHRIDLVVKTDLVLLLPGGPCTHSITSRITVAETVLLGQVPENYTYFSQFDTARDAADAYFDFGAGQSN